MVKEILIHRTESIKFALKKLDKTAKKVLLVVDHEEKLLGTIADGDIRRYILSGKSLDNDIREVYNKKPIYIKKEEFSPELAKEMLVTSKVGLIPIVEKGGKILDFVTWDQLFTDMPITARVNIPVVIVAGGMGSRLEPFTKVFPKPLIPIGDKPVVEVIIDEFKKQGVNSFYLTLNHKGEMVESYFKSVKKDYKLTYIWEKTFLGTAGSLKLLEKKIGDLFIVSNCDVLVKVNFEDAVNVHKKEGALMTVLSSIQHHKIPYGVVKSKEKGRIVSITEKPEYTLTINTGVYIFSKECLKFIPKNSPFDMPDLIEHLIKNNKMVITYPVNESDYIDVGQWEEYKNAVEKLQVLR
ncbi:MAG: NTP transferase domain-containing protein [Candidatus Omnitrophica bacterium]|nr:NTP transferase domain-containing protein [Candidatus Omnitrophota bacterium]